jgi:ketosteroid isomerase-like protein
MPAEPATPDPLETLRGGIDAFNRRDLDSFLAVWAPDAVWEFSQIRMGVFEMSPPTSRGAIRKVVEEYTGAFDDFQTTIEEAHAIGGGVTFAVMVERARPHGSSSVLERRYGFVATWRAGRIARAKNYLDLHQASTAAEQLAEELG